MVKCVEMVDAQDNLHVLDCTSGERTLMEILSPDSCTCKPVRIADL